MGGELSEKRCEELGAGIRLLGLVERLSLGAQARSRGSRVREVAAKHGLHERAEDQVGAAVTKMGEQPVRRANMGGESRPTGRWGARATEGTQT